ncbi:hypothetical protein [Clostridioides sp. ZZV14-5902]|uniref:hypothetical protein n=1 Tax=Clostridioides sp. ZZV14-5902 TaxID=2811486 RepID=UPI001D116E86|nr:hypothetical protein [Clostridioides sp. ZZV14-5902]
MEVNIQRAYTIALEEIKGLQNELILYKALNGQLQEEINELKKEKAETKQNKEQ